MSKYSEAVSKLADLARQINEDSERFWHPEKRPGVMMQIFPNSQLIPGCTQVRVYMMGYKDYEDFSCSFELRADKPFATETVGEKVKEVHIPDAVHNGDLVPDTMPEHPHAMRALVRVQKSESAIYFVSIENLHTAKIQH